MKILIVFILAIAAIPAAAQCNLPIEKAPTLRGVSLGMTKDAVIAKFGKPFSQDEQHLGYVPSMIDLENVGVAPAAMRKMPSEFDGLASMELGLLNNQVSVITVEYKLDKTAWNSPLDFGETLSEKLNLPKSWRFYDLEEAELDCSSFVMKVWPAANRVMLIDLGPMKNRKAAEQAKAAEAKKAFKP